MMRFVAVFVAAAALAAAVSVSLLPLSPAAQAKKPEIIYTFPVDGDVLGETPGIIQMCFAEPINNRDLDKGGDFKFDLDPPDASGVGMRIVFQPDGYGVVILPNIAGKPETGPWTFTYRVTDYNTPDAIEGTINYTVEPGGIPIVKATPPACTGSGTPGPTPLVIGVGGSSVTPSPGGSPTPTSPTDGEDSGSGPDILRLALLTIGAAGGAAVVALIGYAVRNKIGFWLHRPPERTEGEDNDQGHH